MYRNGDLEQFYFQYPTEAKGISVEQFCSRNKVPCKMVQGYTQQVSRSEGGWPSMLGSKKAEGGKGIQKNHHRRKQRLLPFVYSWSCA